MLRRAGALLAGVLLAAACSAGDDDRTATGDAPTTASTGASASDPSTTATQGGVISGPGATTSVSPPEPVTTTIGSAGPAPPSGPTAPVLGAPSAAIAPQAVGRLAPFLLRPGHGDRIVVELRAQAGAAPRQTTIDHVVRVLQEASGKRVLVDGPDPVGGAGQAWTAAALGGLADREAERSQGGDQVVLRLLFLRGTFNGDGGVLGVAVRGDVAAVFSDRVDAAAGLLVDPAAVEDAVSVHEVGHLLGLVDIIVGSGRGDPEHPGHSRNRDSVMYWAVESDAISQILAGGIPNELDADDRAELAAIRRG